MGFAESILFEKIKQSGLSGFSKCAHLEAKSADFGDNPQVFMR